ncbi:hypothetical protein E4U22_008466 [Claviceps purpurea]|uniref:Uncharacterized protein n=1 Tax=Claviceps purpurea (strain 20.1) TaxID=1111077 RepID=M1VVA1_CLAP2|nr:hypothetical protein E4U12_006500 [Claviceps purpurea]CCE29162.1 uncharacterized protein CPUR_02853 [Claviceps purpurea 20.1]KAG6132541.1 hypothetical protein E4U28_006516 [Claviceps purpurea]KAG6158080.1 hypothetical protein E4U37_006438 [Claviceps purpurea]KAG6174288.1 hypothetical protein E4U51_002720 [Claviceps purpurea]
MKFATALIALATAVMASPASLPVEARAVEVPKTLEARCDSCEIKHHQGGYGRYHGQKKHCDNWVPVNAEGIALDINAEICLNLQFDLGFINIDLSAAFDVEIDVALLHLFYPSCQRLVCDPTYSCKKNEPIPEDKCWTHEFDQNKYNSYY